MTRLAAHGRSLAVGLLLAISAAGGGWLRAVPHYGQWAFLALLPLLAVIRCATPPRAALCGMLWGTAILIGSAVRIGDSNLTPLTVLSFVIVPALYAWLAALSVRRAGFHPLVLAVGWLLVELGASQWGDRRGILLPAAIGSGPVGDWIGHHLGFVLLSFVGAFIDSVIIAAAVVAVQGAPHSWHNRACTTPLARLGWTNEPLLQRRIGHPLNARAPPRQTACA